MQEHPSNTGGGGTATPGQDPRHDTGPWPCLPGCEQRGHDGGWTGSDPAGECDVRSEVDSAEFPVAGVEHWFVGAYEASLFGHRSTGEVVQYLELNEEATVNGFGISPKEARRWARGLLRAADRAEGRNRPPLVLAEDECARLLAAIQAIPNTTVSPRVVAGLSLISGEVC